MLITFTTHHFYGALVSHIVRLMFVDVDLPEPNSLVGGCLNQKERPQTFGLLNWWPDPPVDHPTQSSPGSRKSPVFESKRWAMGTEDIRRTLRLHVPVGLSAKVAIYGDH
jgi:hypothetical protein